jgi:hypothetical protein
MFDPNALLLLAALASMPDTVARPTANDSVLASVVGPLVKLGARARVHTGFGIIEGETQTVDPLGLRLRQEAADIWSGPRVKPIAWSQIDRIEVRTRQPATGAKVGAVFGCLVGIAMVASAAASASAYGDSGYGGGGVLLLGAAVGGIAGSCVGGLLGSLADTAAPPWKLVYERR